MTTLILTTGLPGSGKTTRARAWVAEAPNHRVRINRDDYRDMMFGGWTGNREHENAVTAARDAAVEVLLAAGWDVVCDDTNLHPEHLAALKNLGRGLDADVEVWDLTDVPVDVCIARDAERGRRGGRSVGEAVIRGMAERAGLLDGAR